MKTTSFLVAIVLILNNCRAQTKVSEFGEYYKIKNYNISVPFAGQPNISPTQSNDFLSFVSYQYAYPKPGDDINNLYGVDVLKLKYDTLFKTDQLKVEFAAGQFKLMYEKVFGGQLISEKSTDYHGAYGFYQKVKLNTSSLGEFYIQALYFTYKDLVIRMYTFTPLKNEDNKKIKDFYETIKFE